MNNQEETRNCTACKIDRPLGWFVSKAGRTNLKNCQRCRTMKSTKKCEHGKQKTYCTQCGGGSLCQHNRVRARCVPCKGGSICPHDQRKSQCRQCGGSGICKHSRNKYTCFECKHPEEYKAIRIQKSLKVFD